MIIYFLIAILFFLILCLFILLMKPEWLALIQSIIISEKKDHGKEPTPNQENTSEIIIRDNEEANEKLLSVKSKIIAIKLIFNDVHSTNEIKLFSVIDNILDYLGRIGASELFLLAHLEHSISSIDIERPNGDPFHKMDEIALKLLPIQEMLSYYFTSANLYRENLQPFYKSALSELSEELKKFRNLKGILENSETTKVYENAKFKYSTAFYIYLTLFIIAIAGALHFSLYIIKEKEQLKKLGMDPYDYWTIKITCIFIFVTVITFILKQIAHYQKKKDDAERTMLELKALPSYLADLEPKDATNLRKDLATKYFGKSNDNSTLNEIGNIISEQLKNSTEVAKSSAEIIKSLKP